MNATTEQTSPPDMATARTWQPLRVWIPSLLLLAMPVLASIPKFFDDIPQQVMFFAAAGPALMGILILVWWLTFSRASWTEALLGFAGVLLALGVALAVLHPTLFNPAGIAKVTVPLGTAGFAIALILLSRRRPRWRTGVAVIVAALGFGVSALQRSDGMLGNYALQLDWRWNPTAEEALLASKPASDESAVSRGTIAQWVTDPQWSEFRGARRDGVYEGPAIATDWASNPPELVWKISVGPGWSSFAVAGELLFTQEQRGDTEAIVCYSAETGDQIWVQGIETRFEESLGGPGPRATPTIAAGGLFVQGANGHLMRLDPVDGHIVWQVDLRQVADRDPPMWGFASSPLVIDGHVIVHAGGAGDKGVLAFDHQSGDLVWSAPAGDHSYSSPQLNQVAGKPTVLVPTNKGLTMIDPADGTVRLEYVWEHEGYRALQPQVVDGDSILIPTGLGTGTGRIRVADSESGWTVTEQWTSRHLKPDFNDFVIHQGYVYGFDRTTFTCVDLASGERMWKRGRYGAGQVLLLRASNALLVISERGTVVLVEADPSGHRELGEFNALEGKTWNHPVLVGNRLYLRNGQQAACYRLPLAAAGVASSP